MHWFTSGLPTVVPRKDIQFLHAPHLLPLPSPPTQSCHLSSPSHLPLNPATSLPPPTSHLPPPTSHLPPPTSHLPPPTSHLPPPTSHLPPPTSHLPPPTSHLPPPTSHLPPPTSPSHFPPRSWRSVVTCVQRLHAGRTQQCVQAWRADRRLDGLPDCRRVDRDHRSITDQTHDDRSSESDVDVECSCDGQGYLATNESSRSIIQLRIRRSVSGFPIRLVERSQADTSQLVPATMTRVEKETSLVWHPKELVRIGGAVPRGQRWPVRRPRCVLSSWLPASRVGTRAKQRPPTVKHSAHYWHSARDTRAI